MPTAKKQNRILIAALAVILAAAALLIALTGTAAKKEKQTQPPLDARVTETARPSSRPHPATDKPSVLPRPETEAAGTQTAPVLPKDETAAEKTAVPEDSAPTAAVHTDVLPSFTAPVDGLVLKDFSADVPVFSATMNDYRTHTGVDFACSPGTPVKAAADGVVCEVRNDPMMGGTIGIRHSGGGITRYQGLQEESLSLLTVGDAVSRGQVIGASGSTALVESAEEDHLHFSVEVNGKPENPADFFRVTRLADLTED